MSNLTKAIILATDFHKTQFNNKCEELYILHPLRVMLKCKTDEERIVAVLHDVVEDTDATLTYLKDYEGFSDRIIEAIDCLTRRKNESYGQFIDRVKTNELATKVKILDLEDNMDVSRLKEFTDKDQSRLNKYSKAMFKLTDEKKYE